MKKISPLDMFYIHVQSHGSVPVASTRQRFRAKYKFIWTSVSSTATVSLVQLIRVEGKTLDHTEVLKNFFTVQNPLGDIAAVEDIDVHDDATKMLFRSYFDGENQPIQELKLEPSMIVGRKGSGKTDALLSYEFGDPKVVQKFGPTIYFEAPDAAATISNVVNQITNAIYDNYPQPRVEEVASFWDSLFWVTILCGILEDEVASKSEEYDLIKSFIYSLLNSSKIPKSPYHVLLTAIVRMRAAFGESEFANQGISFFGAQGLLTFSGLTISEAKLAGLTLLRKNKKVALILFDSIEALELEEDENRLAIAGLLKTVGAFHDTGASAQFRCCIPAEAYFKLADMSQNVLKDFRKMHRLHWNSAELLRICALRYRQFLLLHSKEIDESYFKDYNDFKTRKDVIRFWQFILPARVPNTKKDAFEATLPYLTRHTQLLPRHVILVLNTILARSIAESGQVEPATIAVENITDSVRDSEPLMVRQILDSYRAVWPDADEILREVLPNLDSNIITYSEMHRRFNRTSVANGVYPRISDFNDFLRMLCELGAVGRLTDRTDEYAVAVFEYSEPSRLIFTPRDTLCIHPIFTEYFRVIVKESIPDDYKPVYPIGTDPDSSFFSSRND